MPRNTNQTPADEFGFTADTGKLASRSRGAQSPKVAAMVAAFESIITHTDWSYLYQGTGDDRKPVTYNDEKVARKDAASVKRHLAGKLGLPEREIRLAVRPKGKAWQFGLRFRSKQS